MDGGQQAVSASLVLVRLGSCRYALPMSSVAEVGRPPALTRVPGLPNWVAGVANWRGRVLAVLDLRPLLAAEIGPGDRRARLVVITHGGATAGLLTEGVDGTADVAAHRIEPLLLHLPAAAAALVVGQITEVAGPIGVLDLAAVFGLADTLARSRRAG